MSDEQDKPTLTRKPLGLKRTVESGLVQQQFSHGRRNTVVVEVKRRRTIARAGEQSTSVPKSTLVSSAPASIPSSSASPTTGRPAKAIAPLSPPRAKNKRQAPKRVSSSEVDSLMTRQERQSQLLREAEDARLTALEDARRRDGLARQRKWEEQRARTEKKQTPQNTQTEQTTSNGSERDTLASEQNLAAKQPSKTPPSRMAPAAPSSTTAPGDAPPAPTSPRATPATTPRAAPATTPRAAPATTATRASPTTPARRYTPVEAPRRPSSRPTKPDREQRRAGADNRRQSGKLTVTRALNEHDGARARSLAALKRAREKERRSHKTQSGPREKQVREVVVPDAITVQELANRMAEKGADLVKSLFKMGMMVTVNQTIDQDTAELLVTEFAHEVKRVSEADIDIDHDADVDPDETLEARAPIVTIMGHVDHGKTSLLDALRGTNVVASEAGGITQHIGAYQVKTKNGEPVVFLDTPGHEAFSQMRARGASVTDIVALVVAADDGLKPQSIEAIAHAKAAGTPLIIVINKIDKPEANSQKVRERLLEHEVIVESMGGEVQDIEISALKGTNLDGLIDVIALQAEIMNLKANPKRAAEGSVIEARLDRGRGPVATILIRRGTLKVGDILVCGTESGRVRAMIDDKGQQVKTAGPSLPVQVLGLAGVPMAGDTLIVVENEARAREVASYRQEQALKERTTQVPINLEGVFSALADKARVIEFPIIVKGDVQGSVEAIVNALENLSTDEIRVRVLHSGVGGITESDVTLAAPAGAPIIGFKARPNAKAREIASREKVPFKYYDVIYQLTEEIAKEMAGELGPERIETVIGRAEIREVFPAGKHGRAAGLLVVDGLLRKAFKARITRNDIIIYDGDIASLRRFKDDVAEVRSGLECGVTFTSHTDIKTGDFLETYEVEERERTL